MAVVVVVCSCCKCKCRCNCNCARFGHCFHLFFSQATDIAGKCFAPPLKSKKTKGVEFRNCRPSKDKKLRGWNLEQLSGFEEQQKTEESGILE